MLRQQMQLACARSAQWATRYGARLLKWVHLKPVLGVLAGSDWPPGRANQAPRVSVAGDAAGRKTVVKACGVAAAMLQGHSCRSTTSRVVRCTS